MAAGTSSRLNTKITKPFLKLNKKPILWYSAYSFQNLSIVKDIYIVIEQNKLSYAKNIQKKYLKKIDKLRGFITGGTERHNSVFNALELIQSKGGCDYIAIHDAARAFVKQELIYDVWNAAVKYGGAAPGIPVIDTIKICNKEKMIISHPKRDKLIAIQTPQIFYFPKIWKAYKQLKNENITFTDDTEIYATLYDGIKIIDGDKDLFKITFDEDLEFAKSVIKKYKKIWN